MRQLRYLFLLIVLLLSFGIVTVQARKVKDVSTMLTPYLAPGSSRPAVIVCPGGSYFWHDMVNEGDAVGRWLQRNGISAFVLRYRTAYVPAFIFHYRLLFRGNRYPDALNDLRQTLRYLRQHAASLHIDGHRIGVMGFSAPIYAVVTMSHPCVHKRSRRGLLGDNRTGNRKLCDSLSLERHVPANCPPVFLVNCKDDPIVPPHNAELLDSALTAKQVPHRYIQYATGGHGFGASNLKGTAECRQWRSRFLSWFKALKL